MVVDPALLASPTNLSDLLKRQADAQPKKLACAYLTDDGEVSAELSFEALDLRARALAARLQGLDASGEPAILLYPPGLDFVVAFFACMYAGVLAIPLPMPRGKANIDQTKGIIEDTSCELLLSTRTFISKLIRHDEAYFDNLIAIDTQLIDDELARAWQPIRSTSGDEGAYLQYTSGSTSSRKGVIVTHANVIENIKGIDRGFQHDATSVAVNWLPHFHDLGLVSGILQPLYHGNTNYLMAPTALVQRPIRWLSAISTYGATHTNSPNYAYDLCIKKITPEQLSGIDLSAWRIALNGAEPVRAETVREFYAKFKDVGLSKTTMYPAYGLAEATLVVSAGLGEHAAEILTVDANALERGEIQAVDAPNGRELVACGEALDQTVIAIVEPRTGNQLPENTVGEIWVSGPGVAAGYWQNDVATEETFQCQLPAYPDRFFLRTGDLGFLRDEQLYITGREKDLIIIRGANHYPQDIEWTVENSHSAFKPGCGAAFSITEDGIEKLVVVFEIERDQLKSVNIDEVAKCVRQQVAAEHELQLYTLVLLKTTTVARTSSGKIQRSQCKKQFLADELQELDRWTQLQQQLAPELEPLNAEVNSSNQANYSSHMSVSKSPDELIHWLRDFSAQRLDSRSYDERRLLAPHVILEFGNQGILGLQAAEKYGGLAYSTADTLRVVEQIAAIDLTLAMLCIVHNTLGITPLEQSASETLKQQLLPKLASGRELVAFAITEPAAGSNPRAITTTARQIAPGKWQLSGEKIWSGTAGWSSVINVFAQQLDLAGEPQGMIGFAVPVTTAGVKIGPEAQTFGMRAMVQNKITFSNVEVSQECLLGEPGAGMSVAQYAMQRGRLMIAAACVGGMKRCVQLMVRYGANRTISTGNLLANGVWLSRLAEITSQIEALEALLSCIGRLEDTNTPVSADIFAVLKITAPEYLWQAADALMQMLGGRGYIENNIAPQLLRDARVARILEGPTEALQMFLGVRVIKDSKDYYAFLAQSSLDSSVIAELKDCVGKQAPIFGNHHGFLCAVGELAAHAVLMSARGQGQQTDAAKKSQTIPWAQMRWRQLLTSVQEYKPLDSAFDASQAQRIATEYQRAIGDIEQQLPGFESYVDSYLSLSEAKNHSSTQNTSLNGDTSQDQRAEVSFEGDVGQTLNNLQPTSRSANPDVSEKVQTLADFMIKWLAEELKLAPDTIKSNDTFFEHGVDSVVSVMLTVAIEDEIGFLIEPEVVYDYPRIDACAKEITRRAAKES